MSASIVSPGGLVVQDPNDQRVYVFDWDAENLDAGITIVTSSFTITAIRPSDDTALQKDNEGVLSGSRKTSLRLYGGTVGALYEVANKVVTSASPAETKERSFKLKVENL